LRLRLTLPVSHHVRVACQLKPASRNTNQIVYVLTWGNPSGALRSARCRVVSDHVAVPSRSRSGIRLASLRMRSRSATPRSVVFHRHVWVLLL
jgi:hypothetical protein